jgi:hypothetical protein
VQLIGWIGLPVYSQGSSWLFITTSSTALALHRRTTSGYESCFLELRRVEHESHHPILSTSQIMFTTPVRLDCVLRGSGIKFPFFLSQPHIEMYPKSINIFKINC